MSSLRKQVAELEKRIAILENAMNVTGDAEADRANRDRARASFPYKTKDIQWEREPQKKMAELTPDPVPGDDSVNKGKRKLNEVRVGRYLEGALASLLVFAGAVSLIALFWGDLTPQLKLSLLVSAGVILTAVGLIRIKSHKNAITSIILGTGSGLLFISILAANLAFSLISSTTAYLLAGIWSVAFLVVYGYTRTFFTTLIAYLGSYIAMGMGLFMAKSVTDIFVVIVFTLAVILVMIGSGMKWFDVRKQLLCTGLSWASIGTLIYGSMNLELFVDSGKIGLVVGLLVLLLYAAWNRFCYLNEKSGYQYAATVLAILTGLITIHYTQQALSVDIGIKNASAVLLCIFIAQFLLNEWKEHPERKKITVTFSIFQGCAAILYLLHNF